MAGLQADISSEFLKNFIPETVYLLQEDITAPAPEAAQETEAKASTPTTDTAPAPVAAPEPAPTRQAVQELPKIPKPAPAPQKYVITGQNQKGAVILVTLPEAEFTQLPQLQFLQKILAAIGLRPADVAYVNNISGKTAQFEDLQQQLQVNYIISFASRIDTTLPHERFTLYKPVKIGSVPVVFSHALAKLEHDVEHKKLLWGALQKTFNL